MNELQIKYLMTFNKKIDELNLALRERDINKLRNIGHKLQGSGASYGFNEISEYGKLLNQVAKLNNFEEIDKVIKLLEEFVLLEKKKRGID